MLSLTTPLGRLPFAFGVSIANTALLLVAFLSFAFLPSGAGHIAVLVIMGALMGWWFFLHARRFAAAGKGALWPLAMTGLAFLTFAVSYGIIAALWSMPEVQQEAFRTGGTDFTKHIETNEAVIGFGRWMLGWAGAAGAIALSGALAVLMGLVSLVAACFSFLAMLLPNSASNASAPLVRPLPGRR